MQLDLALFALRHYGGSPQRYLQKLLQVGVLLRQPAAKRSEEATCADWPGKLILSLDSQHKDLMHKGMHLRPALNTCKSIVQAACC